MRSFGMDSIAEEKRIMPKEAPIENLGKELDDILGGFDALPDGLTFSQPFKIKQ